MPRRSRTEALSLCATYTSKQEIRTLSLDMPFLADLGFSMTEIVAYMPSSLGYDRHASVLQQPGS